VEKPLGLMRDLVQICPPGGTVLDPFQGSGTTGVAALMEGLRYIGIEAVEHYHRVACERLAQAEDGAS
ncbi:MAG: DNA methyltransferase, partial [Thiobacillaceae bacterium]